MRLPACAVSVRGFGGCSKLKRPKPYILTKEFHLFKPQGIMPALVTPFTYDQKGIDEEKLRFLINHCIDLGVHGVVVCGTTGEFTNLTVEERKRIVKTAVEEANGRVPVIAQTGATTTQQAIELTKHAKDTGAQAALIVAPYFLKTSSRNLYEHYSTIASSVDIPIILYNIPQCAGNTLSPDLVEDLAELPNVVGVKDSSGQLNYLMSVLEKVRDKISVLCGSDEVVVPALAAGCSGAILASANVIPEVWLNIYRYMRNGEVTQARELQFQVQKLLKLFSAGGVAATKEALNMCRVSVGPPRKPYGIGGELTYENREELRLELERLGKTPRQPVEAGFIAQRLEQRFTNIELPEDTIQLFKLRVSEAQAGEETEEAHIDLVMGSRTGPVGTAFVQAKATPTPGHEPLLAILESNVSVKPVTLIVPTVTIKSMRQATMVFGPAQNAVAKAVVDSVFDGTLPKDGLDELLIIVNVYVHPAAINKHRIYVNNYQAMRTAIRKAMENKPKLEDLASERELSEHQTKYIPWENET
jgi:4-hydroxy-tetrahydrodipicolinate synthase